MPVIGLGTANVTGREAYDMVRLAIEVGYRHFDCAPIYKNEKEVGEALRDAIKAGAVKREDLWITSKLWNSNHRYNDVERSLEETLKAMKLDYVDLYLIHWPIALERGVDWPEKEEDYLAPFEAPLEDTWTGMEDCKDEELTRHIGVSNFNIGTIQRLINDGMMPVECLQVELHPYLPQQALYDFCRQNKIAVTAYAPFGSPARPAQFKHANEPNLLKEPAIVAIAQKHGCTPAQALLAWSLTRKTSVVAKSANRQRMEENLAAAEITLDREDLRELIILPKFRYFKGEEYITNGSPYKLTDIWEY